MANNFNNLTFEYHSGRDGVNLYKQTSRPNDKSILTVVASLGFESVDRRQFDTIRGDLIRTLIQEIVDNIEGYSSHDLGFREITLGDGSVAQALLSEVVNDEARSHQQALDNLRNILKSLRG